MNKDAGSSPDVETKALTKSNRGRPQERLDIDRRRRLVAKYRFVRGFTEQQISKVLREKHGIEATQQIVNRDIQKARVEFRKYYGNREQFEATEEVAKVLARYERIVLWTMRRAQAEKDNGKFATLMRAATQASTEYTALLQSVGLVDKRLGTLFIAPEDGKRSERLPTGTQLSKLFEDTKILEGEIVADAERAWLYGDAAASAQAAAEFETRGGAAGSGEGGVTREDSTD